MNDGFQRILVIKLRHLGDVLLCTPVFRLLAERFPGAEIFACVSPGTGQILEDNARLAGVLDGKTGSGGGGLAGLREDIGLIRSIRRRRFDLAIDLTTSDRSAILARFSGAKRRIGFTSFKGFAGRSRFYTDRVPPALGAHMVRRHLEMLRPLGIEPREVPLEFPISAEDRQLAAGLIPGGGKVLQVHPVSRIARKNWPVEFLAELLGRVSKLGWKAVITGGSDPAEQEYIRKLMSALGPEHLDLSGRLTLKQLGAVSDRADCFLGVDTAPMHIAAATGTPVIGMFGPSSERLWSPWMTRSLVLSRDLSCRLPCKDKGCQTIECLREMTPGMVWPRVQGFLSGLG